MSIDLRERKKLKRRTISLMDDWVFKAVIGDPEDEVCLSSFFQAIDPDFRKVRLLPGEKKAGHPDDKAIRYDICGVINEKIYFDLSSKTEIPRSRESASFSIYRGCFPGREQRERIIGNCGRCA